MMTMQQRPVGERDLGAQPIAVLGAFGRDPGGQRPVLGLGLVLVLGQDNHVRTGHRHVDLCVASVTGSLARHADTPHIWVKMGRRGEVPRLDQDVPATAAQCPSTPALARTDPRRGASPRHLQPTWTASCPTAPPSNSAGCATPAPPTNGTSRSTAPATTTNEQSIFPTGLPFGTCEDALDTACGLYLGDPTAWT